MGSWGMGELLIVLLVVLLVFGASRLPQIGEGLGKAIKSLKRGLAADDDIDVTPEKKQVSSDSSAEKVDEGKPQGGSSTSNVSDAEIVDQKQS